MIASTRFGVPTHSHGSFSKAYLEGKLEAETTMTTEKMLTQHQGTSEMKQAYVSTRKIRRKR